MSTQYTSNDVLNAVAAACKVLGERKEEITDDAKAIAKAPGIGLKTAQKLILELKDKLSLEEAFEARLENSQAKAAAGAAPDLSEARNEAVEALTAGRWKQPTV